MTQKFDIAIQIFTESGEKRKDASAVIKVSDQRIYCRAVNAKLASGLPCVIHIPVVVAKKNKYKAFIRKK